MEEITIYDLSPTELLDIVYRLKESGYHIGSDFEFAYTPGAGEYINGVYVNARKSATFSFSKEEDATWFLLKYGE